MKALVSPNEINEKGFYRIADVVEKEFDVAEPMFWIECSNETIADYHAYDPTTKEIVVARIIEIPPPPPEEEVKE